MNLAEIKKAVDSGQTVYWSSNLYTVIKDSLGQYLIKCSSNNHSIGLTWRNGKTLNGVEYEFFISNQKPMG